MNEAKIAAVVLAGGQNSPEMRQATGTENRALVRLGDQTMLDYVIDALRGAEVIGRIIVVGDVPSDPRYEQITPGETLMDNLMAGLTAVGPGVPRVLTSTSDIPFLTAAGVQDFAEQSLASGADLCYPIVPMEIYQQQFSEMKRTTLRLREGNFTGGNLLLVNPQFLLNNRETIMRAYAARKSVFQIGRMLGWGLLVRVVAAQTVAPSLLTLARLEAGVGHLLGGGCRAAAIVTQYPEIGTDVDKPDDVRIAQERLKTRN